MTKRCLVFETLGSVTNLAVQESANSNEVRLTGVFGVCGIKNGNNRIYDKANYGKMVESLQKVIMSEGCPGELEHPNTMNIDLNNVSHKIESIEMNEDGTITGTILLLNTPKGQIAKAIVESGLPLYISSRGAGNIDESGHVTLSTIKTYDLVGTPGFSQAKLSLKKNQTLESLNESLDDGNIAWAIVESDDDAEALLGDDDDEKKDKSSDEKPKDDNKDEEEKKPEEKEEKKDDDESKKDDNNKNSENTTTMNDLKQSIDELVEKVTQLEAELHVAQESLNSKEDTISELTEKLNSIKETNYEAIETWVNEEFANELQIKIDAKIDEAVEDVKTWVANDYNEHVQTWVNEEFAPKVQDWVVEEFAPEVQNWVCEEFAPEVQNWVCEEFAPEVQGWICEEFAPEVQNWVCEEFAPQVEGWICEEFAPQVEGWITEEFAPEQENKINENINEFMESQKSAKLDEIDALLESMASNKDAALEIMKEEKAKDKYAGVYVIENMPAQYQPAWNGLNEERQAEILRSSKAYDFTKEGVLESFWAAVDFNTEKKETKVNENLDQTSGYYNNIIAQMNRLRK